MAKKYHRFNNPTLTQGGWTRTGEGNDYIRYAPDDPNYNYRICTLEYVPQHHPTQITITGIASEELEVSVLVLRSDNYIIASLTWQDNGYTFNLGSTYDKLGVMFRYQSGRQITPENITDIRITNWSDLSPKIYNTSTDIITHLPAELIPDGQLINGIIIKGNMQQSGTPSSSSPIYPAETGDKTANLWDGRYYDGYVGENGYYYPNDDTVQSAIIQCEPNSVYTITKHGDTKPESARKFRIAEYSQYPDATTVGNVLFNDSAAYNATVTTGNSAKYIVIYVLYKSTGSININLMVNTGSTALPLEPFGYKIPVSCGGVTTNVYLGEVQSTRKVKKVVLTGEENITDLANTYYTIPANNVREWERCFCSHCKYGDIIGGNSPRYLWIKKEAFTDYPTDTDFKAYLVQQYAAGTPVCVWYVLATEETGIVNEPIRRIGNYADSVSVANIPTTAGSQQFDVTTTLKPSEVDLTYHGWHPKQDKEYSGGSWS